MNNIKIGKLSYIKRFAAVTAIAGCVVLTSFSSFADMVSDAPVISSGSTDTGSVSSEPVISDAPMVVTPETKVSTEIVVVETSSSSQNTSAPLEDGGAKVEETLPALSAEPETKTSVSVKNVSESTASDPVISVSETTAAAETASVAELPSITEQETTKAASVVSIVSTPTIETKETVNVSAPQTRNVSSDEAGANHANDSVTRIYLDFSLISPSHKYGSTNVARASVKLSDGTWQKFEYKEHVRYPFYRMVSQGTDSDGDSCYVAAVRARRFGDSTTDDGEMKNELYLKASDCSVRNYLDISTTNQTRIAIVKAALSMLGKEYTYGGNGPDAYDCSGLVKAVMAKAGISVPRTSTQLLAMDGQISASELRPGDIMARAGHCGIYIGNGIFIHASDSSVGVIAEYLSVYNQVNKFTNCINVVGD